MENKLRHSKACLIAAKEHVKFDSDRTRFILIQARVNCPKHYWRMLNGKLD